MPDEESLSTLSGNADAATLRPTIETNPYEYSRGYQKLAWLMGKLPEFALFRRFGHLNSLNLLYLQTELHELEWKLHEISSIYANSDDDTGQRNDFERASVAKTDAAGTHTEQYKLVLEIREKLKEYNQEIWLQSQIARLPEPINTDHRWLRLWMSSPNMGNTQWLGSELQLWDCAPKDDFIAIKAREYSDSMTTWFATKFIAKYHRYVGKYIHKHETEDGLIGNMVYTERGNNKFMAALTASLSSAFPVLSIVILNQTSNLNLRLAILTLFTIFFSASLSLLSPAKKLETFAAAAAFAAVNVVFIRN